ncbi:hypothetical protein [Nitrincola alkalilacustris]|nr:hypothetical protein [Nitrincola alkalilacustris]
MASSIAGTELIGAVWMSMAAVAMLAGLGVYLYLSREPDSVRT